MCSGLETALRAENWNSQKQHLICVVFQITDLMSCALKPIVSYISSIFVGLFQIVP